MVNENFNIFTTRTLRQGFYDPDKPESHTKEREKGKEAKDEKKSTLRRFLRRSQSEMIYITNGNDMRFYCAFKNLNALTLLIVKF